MLREGPWTASELDSLWGQLLGSARQPPLTATLGNGEVAATLLGATERLREARPRTGIGIPEVGVA